jgi:hypothetical protein
VSDLCASIWKKTAITVKLKRNENDPHGLKEEGGEALYTVIFTAPVSKE